MAYTKKNQDKKVKRGRKPYLEINQIEQLYKIINKIQTSEEAVYIYLSDQIENLMIENILKDAEINYKKNNTSKGVVFKLFPSKRETPDINIDVDFFDDEQIEEGELF